LTVWPVPFWSEDDTADSRETPPQYSQLRFQKTDNFLALVCAPHR
jgi:hypothetical protein